MPVEIDPNLTLSDELFSAADEPVEDLDESKLM